MSLNAFFDMPEKDTSFYPLYTEYNPPDFIKNLRWIDIKKMTETEFSDIMEKYRLWIIDLYEKHNHPLFGGDKSLKEIIEGFRKFDKLDVDDLLKMVGGKPCINYVNSVHTSGINHWFPEMSFVMINKTHSPMYLVYDKEKFHKTVVPTIYKDSMGVSKGNETAKVDKHLITILKRARGTQKVGQFPPYVAKFLFTSILQKIDRNDLYVYDPCAGWGGRLLAMLAAASYKNLKEKDITFITTDVNSTTHPRFEMIYKFWKEFVNPDMTMKFHKSLTPAEDIDKDPEINQYFGKGDIVFTSPPYYNKELYSEDPDQSYIRYKSYSEWRIGFLEKMIQNIRDFLRPGGTFYLNIADVSIKESKKLVNVQDDSVQLSLKNGFELEDTYQMLMQMPPGAGMKDKTKNLFDDGGDLHKFEPIFRFVRK